MEATSIERARARLFELGTVLNRWALIALLWSVRNRAPLGT
jgi:hypothetical protein